MHPNLNGKLFRFAFTCKRDVVHRMNEGSIVWRALKNVLRNRCVR